MATRNSKLEERVVALETALEDIKVTLAKLEAREAVCIVVEDRLTKLERLVGDVASSVEACRVRLEERDAQWPVVGRKGNSRSKEGGRNVGSGAQAETKVKVPGSDNVGEVSVCDLFKDATGKVLVVGDSLARGMGHKLRYQCGNNLVQVEAVGGAKLGQVADSVAGLCRDESRQLVVVAGANSMVQETASEMLEKFENIIEHGKRCNKKVVVAGLVRRFDLGREYECKRIVVNARLKRLCVERDVGFVEYEPERSRVHKDGLHLNHRGQYEFGRKVFVEVRRFFEGFLE